MPDLCSAPRVAWLARNVDSGERFSKYDADMVSAARKIYAPRAECGQHIALVLPRPDVAVGTLACTFADRVDALGLETGQREFALETVAKKIRWPSSRAAPVSP